MTKITEKEYWKEVKDLAKQVEEQVKEYDQDPHDALHETIDGHQWLIYYAYHPWILAHTRNEDAVFDIVGEVSGDSTSAVLTQIAFYALYQDVSDAIDWDELHENNPKHTRPEKPRKKKRKGKRAQPYARTRPGGGRRGNPKKKKVSGVRSLVSKALK